MFRRRTGAAGSGGQRTAFRIAATGRAGHALRHGWRTTAYRRCGWEASKLLDDIDGALAERRTFGCGRNRPRSVVGPIRSTDRLSNSAAWHCERGVGFRQPAQADALRDGGAYSACGSGRDGRRPQMIVLTSWKPPSARFERARRPACQSKFVACPNASSGGIARHALMPAVDRSATHRAHPTLPRSVLWVPGLCRGEGLWCRCALGDPGV
jgi:hypothetical protein